MIFATDGWVGALTVGAAEPQKKPRRPEGWGGGALGRGSGGRHPRCPPLPQAEAAYIMPMPSMPPPGGIAGGLSSLGASATLASVVMRSPAIDAAF